MTNYPLLAEIRSHILKNPDDARDIISEVLGGLGRSESRALYRAADMEVALSVALNPRVKDGKDLILSKLKKWEGETSLDWSTTIKQLEKDVLK